MKRLLLDKTTILIYLGQLLWMIGLRIKLVSNHKSMVGFE